MKYSTHKLSLWAIGCLLLASSCNQFNDYLPSFNSHNNTVNKYKLSKIVFNLADETYGESERITYFNGKGEPSKTTATEPSTGNSHQAFIYNNKGYLTQLVTHFGDAPSPLDLPSQSGNSNFVVHLYTNNNKGEIVVDSFYYAGGSPIHGTGNSSFLQTVTKYYYDSYSRLIRKESTYIPNYYGEPTTDITTYVYGSNGNLVGNTYDNKLSLKRFSNVMMFLNEDYSVNNKISTYPFSSSYAYNTNGLASTVNGVSLLPYESDQTGTSLVSYVKR